MAKSKYEEDPVEYCLACGSLHLIEDDYGSVLCMNCGASDFTAMSSDIKQYLRNFGDEESTENLPH